MALDFLEQKSVLIIDDFVVMRRIMKTLCEQLEIKSVHESSGIEDAIKSVENIKYDLVFVSHSFDESEVEKLIRNLDKELLVVVANTSDDDYSREEVQSRINMRLDKPFSKMALKNKLIKLLRKQTNKKAG